MYYLRVRDYFSAAHYLRGYKGKCEALHGHNWAVEMEAGFDRLDSAGMGMDYKDMKRILREIIEPFDHTELNRLTIFFSQNPTTENIARFVYEEAKKRLSEYDLKRLSITVWESEDSCCRYEED